jgi:putative sigma-54 modulation protein
VEVHVRGNGIAVNDDLRDYVDQRLAKLDRLVSRVVDAKVELRHRHNRVGPDTVTAQLTIKTRRNILRAEEDDAEVKVAIDRAVDKLSTQLRRFHERRTDHKPARADLESDPTTDAVLAEIVAPVAADEDDEETERLVRTKRFALKPMDVDEAIDQMELLGHDFFLFDNSEEGTLSVVYRRHAGDYGLLVPVRS